jgi:hypothetical protein
MTGRDHEREDSAAMTTTPILDPTPDGIETAADCIRDGGVVVAPSDTNLALTLDPWDEGAIERAFRTRSGNGEAPVRDVATIRRGQSERAATAGTGRTPRWKE